MALEQRLRDELGRSADSVRFDTDAALGHVIVTARRRQRMRRTTLAVGAVALVMAGVIGITQTDLAGLRQSPGPANQTTRPTQPVGSAAGGHAYTRTDIFGEWQTVPYSSQRVRSAVASAGLTREDADNVLEDAQRWRVQANFTTGTGGPVVVFNTWDPGNAVASLRISDQFPYATGPHNRLVLTPISSSSRWVFSYRVTGDRLQLHFLSASPQLEHATLAMIIAWTAAPLTLVQ